MASELDRFLDHDRQLLGWFMGLDVARAPVEAFAEGWLDLYDEAARDGIGRYGRRVKGALARTYQRRTGRQLSRREAEAVKAAARC